MYQWRTQGLFKVDAAVAAQEIEKCRDENGVTTPARVVERAKSPDNPLHSEFEWCNEKAATKWREQQARVLIANLIVFVTPDDDKLPIMARAFIHLSGDEETEKGYKHLAQVLESKVDTQQMLNRAKAELRSFRLKYANLKKIAGMEHLFDAIEDVLQEGA